MATVGVLAGAGPAAAAQLDVVADGRGAVTIDPVPAPLPGVAGVDCAAVERGTAAGPAHCSGTVDPGQAVTFTATADVGADASGTISTFASWSDPRCPPAPSCTLVMDDPHQAVVAVFSPQRVLVKTAGVGTVTTTAGVACGTADPADGFAPALTCGDYPPGTEVTLVADGAAARWDPDVCDGPPGTTADGKPTCTVTTSVTRWTHASFDGQPFDTGNPPQIVVHFRVVKQGTGSGTVRSGGPLDCGGTCSVDEAFGRRESLVAQPAPGSTFTQWRGACSTAPDCSLAVGPVTALGAVFDVAATPGQPASGSGGQPSGAAPFAARVQRVAVRGRGRHRTVLIRIEVNARATVRATLDRGRRRVAARRWSVAAGQPLLRLRVPRRARPGAYRLTVSIRDAAGHGTRTTSRVRLGR
ncbi:MAG: trimeric autotransporter adhesin [Solirubrobacteraceae bacterium]|jgi:hypothetical protein|nr:trimeric autotransporter adhesin [Solirubrobacteraceae bacterium]